MSVGGPAAALATAGVVVALDQATKQWAISGIERGEHVDVFFGLELTNARNTGVAFGAFEGGGALVAILIGVSLTLLLGGALGNLADRVRIGGVIDFIDPIAWPAFNVADSCIVVGVLALLYVVEGRPRRTSSG